MPRKPALRLGDLSAEPVRYRIPGLLTERGNVIFSAYRKTGATTLVWNLIAALTDRKKNFLGGLECYQLHGRVMYADFDMGQQSTRYCAEWQGCSPDGKVILYQGSIHGFCLSLVKSVIPDRLGHITPNRQGRP